jgi:diguanylate cyclase (GGDEF)-like protein/PAS domain S-box-containing protein
VEGGNVTTRRLLTGYALWMVALTIAEFTYPSLRLVFWSAIGFSSSAAVLYGVFRNRPRRRLPWVLVSLALLVFTVGDAIWIVLTQLMHEDNPFPSIADVFYLAMYPLLVAGLLLLPRSSTGRDRAGILDALVLTAGLGLLSWIFLINPYLRDETLGSIEKLTSIAYPLSDILFLAAAAWLVTAVRPTPAVVLMAIGGVSLLLTDFVYGIIQLEQRWNMGSPIDIGWIVFYATWGAAALHPSMTELTEPKVVRETPVTSTRMFVLTLSALIAPGVLLFEELFSTINDAVAIAVLSATIFLLVLLRLAGVVRTNRRAAERERSLREAGANLLSATDVETVRATVRTAVTQLFPPGARHETMLSLRDDPSDHPADQPADHAAEAAVDHFAEHRGAAAAADPIDGLLIDRTRTAEPTARPHFARTADLPPAHARTLADYEIALVNPIAVAGGVAGRRLAGALVVAADDANLGALQGSVEVLASQAALAVERITLGAEIARRNSEQYFRTLVRNSADVILILDDANRIRYASPSAAGMFGGRRLAGIQIEELVEVAQRDLASQLLGLVQAGQDGSARADWTVLGADRGEVEVEVSCRDLREDPTVGGLVVTMRDVTEQRGLERELKHRAFHDSLTGLPNRMLFTEQADRAVARTKGGAVVGVLVIDLDDFKIINDTLGHDIGDHLLVEVSHRLAGTLGPMDTAARLGGDEFALLVEDAGDAAAIDQIAERTVQALAAPVTVDGSQLSASASIGVATTVDAGGSGDLLRQADLALYEAKGAGKRRWRRYQPGLHSAVVERVAMRADLDQAIADGDFAVHYQPIVRLADGVTVGFEALVRWQHPTRGMIPPLDFIDVAEDTGQIVPIGGWVLHQALADAVTWARAAPHDYTYLSVNVSARQFRTAGFIDRVRDELAATGLPPGRLMLEITESLLLRDDEQVWTDLTALRENGIRVAIDDFGTGYSSLSYLRQVPIDVVKIDKSFIDTMVSSPQQRALVEGIVRLAHTLGLQVIAEGIQRPSDRDLLVDLGCTFGQGYLFSRPMTDGDALRWLRADVVA